MEAPGQNRVETSRSNPGYAGVTRSDGDRDRPRLFVIDLDGATRDLIGPWMEDGSLPNLQRLAISGVLGDLESVYPPVTGPAWASFMTGEVPANHGVFEFFHREPGSYHQILNSRRDVDGQSIWRVLSEAGKQVVVLGVPLTYPPEAVNGFMVTGLLTPRHAGATCTYPPELGAELSEILGAYLAQRTATYSKSPQCMIEEEHAILDGLMDAAIYMLRSGSWDFFIMHVLGTDLIQHRFWHLTDPIHIAYDASEISRLGNPVLEFWMRVDERLGEVLAELPSSACVMVISDHGFGPVAKYINFNVWLLQSGFMHLKRDARLGFGSSRFDVASTTRPLLGLARAQVRSRERWDLVVEGERCFSARHSCP